MKTKRSWTELAALLSHRELLFALCCRSASDEAASAASGRRKQKPRDALWSRATVSGGRQTGGAVLQGVRHTQWTQL